MRRAIRARRDRDIVESIEPSLEAEGLALPSGEDDLQRLEETVLALLVGNAEGVVGAGAAAPADPEIEPPLTQLIQGGDFAGHTQRMIQRQELDGSADPKTFGAGHCPAGDEEGCRQHRAGRVDHHLGEPDDVEPPGLGGHDELRDLMESLGLTDAPAHLLGEDSEVHWPFRQRASGRMLTRRAGRGKSLGHGTGGRWIVVPAVEPRSPDLVLWLLPRRIFHEEELTWRNVESMSCARTWRSCRRRNR